METCKYSPPTTHTHTKRNDGFCFFHPSEKQGRAYGNIGSCYELLKDYPEAVFYHQKRLEVARITGDMYSELCTLCNLGNCLRAKGSLDEALEYYQMVNNTMLLNQPF